MALANPDAVSDGCWSGFSGALVSLRDGGSRARWHALETAS